MKIRTGFVSNSSSSSYVISLPNYKNISKEEIWKNLGDYCDWLNDDYEPFDDGEKEYIENKKQKIQKAIDKGLLVKVIDIDYGCCEGDNLLEFLQENFDAEVLVDEN